jgi:ribosomal-protein-alanine N-acetyltransferase
VAVSPTLETTRCVLEPFAEHHISERYVSWLNDPDVVRFSEQRRRGHTADSCRVYWKSYEGTPHYFMAIVARDAALGHIGNINAYVDETNSIADIGILVGEKKIWGKGYGAEAWMAMCRFLLYDKGLSTVTAGTLAINTGMIGIMRHAGMAEESHRRRRVTFEDRDVDVVYATLRKEDFKG